MGTPPIDPESRAMLALSLTPGLGPVRIARAIERFGSAVAAIEGHASAWTALPRMPRSVARDLNDGLARADDELGRIAQHEDLRLIVRGQPEFPPLLAQIPDPPPVLYVRGSLDNGFDYPIAIVGPRRASAYGLEQADRFASQLSANGLSIVSGGARGVDAAAHTAALRERGHTVAVLGCGIDRCYPPEHAGLFEQIVQAGGAVVSEFPMGTEPSPDNFPRRNRVVSGLCLGVLIVEAARRSGALITARLAVEEHDRMVFALPGRIDAPASEGVHRLIRDGGAMLCTSPADVLEDLESSARFLYADRSHAAEHRASPPLAETEADSSTASASADPPSSGHPLDAQILAALDERRTIDDIAIVIGVDIADVRVRVTLLELAGAVTRQGNALERRSRGREIRPRS